MRTYQTDSEFLPAALSILETPPSPVKIGLIWAISALFLFFSLWSYFGKIDVIAVAQGKVQPAGHVKTIQTSETGRVAAVRVENGRHVKKGDELVSLDAAEAQADHEDALAALRGSEAERLRRLAALAAAQSGAIENPGPIVWPADMPSAMQKREELVLAGDLRQLAASIKSLDAQIEQKTAEQDRLRDVISAETNLIATVQQRVTMRLTLQARDAGSKASVMDAQEFLQSQLTTLATQKGQLNEARAATAVLIEDRKKAIETFKAENSQKLAEAERRIDDYAQKVTKGRIKLDRMTIASPIDGVVMGLSITTVGQVVSPSEEVMRIVPEGDELVIEAYVENKDIGFVKAGQTASIKIEAFPFTRYGVLDGRVVRIAHDAIPEPDVQAIEANPARKQRSNAFLGGAQRTQNLVFPVTLALPRKATLANGTELPLMPGMSATVEIKTSKRRVIDYLFAPVLETMANAMKEP